MGLISRVSSRTYRYMSTDHIKKTQDEVNQVIDIMRDNVERVIDRDVKLGELDARADALQAGASQFESHATQLRRKYWWKNMRMWLIIGGVCVVVFMLIVLTMKTKSNDPAPVTTNDPLLPEDGDPSLKLNTTNTTN